MRGDAPAAATSWPSRSCQSEKFVHGPLIVGVLAVLACNDGAVGGDEEIGGAGPVGSGWCPGRRRAIALIASAECLGRRHGPRFGSASRVSSCARRTRRK